MATRFEAAATVVVQVHPLADSYNAALLDRVVASLGRPPCWRLAAGEAPPDDALAGARRLVLVYPTWNGGLPSALLGWVQARLDAPAPLAGVTEVAAVTTHGSSRLVNRVQGEWGRRYLRTELVPRCRPGARLWWVPLYRVDRRDGPSMAAHLDRVERRLARTAAPGPGSGSAVTTAR